jgi:8-oxo-dGTP pyrophosphatase MutT (NUDIX family)
LPDDGFGDSADKTLQSNERRDRDKESGDRGVFVNQEYDYLYGSRARATAIVRRNGALLLVRERGFRQLSLPGGGVHDGETPEEAVARELEEETGLSAIAIKPLPHCETSDTYNTYLVFEIMAEGDIRMDPTELDGLRWWDGSEPVPMFGYVHRILDRLRWPK